LSVWFCDHPALLSFPTRRSSDLLVAVGLIGTTVVPYNLFLHAAAVRERWSGPEHLPVARLDLTVSIALGAVVSMAVVATAASLRSEEHTSELQSRENLVCRLLLE